MKRMIFTVLLNMISIALVAHFIPGMKYGNGIVTLLIVSVILALATIFVKPIIKIFTLPIELITLGIFGILVNAAMLYVTTLVVPNFSIQGFYFSGLTTPWFIFTPHQIPFWGTTIIASVGIGIITSTIAWLTD